MIRALAKILTALTLGAALGLAALLWFLPALRGALCPPCYGLEQVTPVLWVEAEMSGPARLALSEEIVAARVTIAAFYGPPRAHLRILACVTDACDRQLGGRGAAAVTYSLGPWSVVRLAPRGLSRIILTHELAHTETHAHIGLTGQLGRRLPTWFDEGLSVVISDDPRYLGPGSGPARCLRPPQGTLPASAFDWGPMAARDRMLYADAACAVEAWLAAHGGLAGLLDAMDRGAALP